MIKIALAVSLAVYRVLLLRFPAELRRRHRNDMLQLFAEDLEQSMVERGLWGGLAVWRKSLRDLVRPLPRRIDRDPPRAPRGSFFRTSAFGEWGEDLIFAGRALRRERGFLLTATTMLGAGIALNACVFAIVNAYLVRPLPYPEADRLVSIRSPVDLLAQDAEGILEKKITWDLDAFTLVGDQGPELTRGAWVTPDFLEAYGVVPALGRNFSPDEGGPGAASVAIIGYGLWQERYGGSPEVLGTTLQAYTSDRPDDAESFTIVGVLPSDFWHFNDYTEILAPLREERDLYAGRLVANLPAAEAATRLTERVRARVAILPPDFAVEIVGTQDRLVADIRPTIMALQYAVLLVLFIACANVAVLLLVRSARRERELGVRQALGAGRMRLGRQLVFEGGLLACGAGSLGLTLAWLGLRGVRALSDLPLLRTIPGGSEALTLDGTVLAVTIAICFATGTLFGLIPLVSTERRELVSSLGDSERRSTDTPARRRARGAMVAAEIAFSLALLVGSGLLVQSAISLQNRDLGFQPEGIYKGQVGLRQTSYPTPESRLDFFDALSEQVRSMPGVEDVGLVSAVPFTWGFGAMGVETEEGRVAEGVVHVADGGYFETLGIRTLRGRSFTADDALGAEPVAIVSQTLAQDLWHGEEAVGRRLRIAPSLMSASETSEEPWATVVGVVADVRKGVGGTSAGDLYGAFAQAGPLWMNLSVRVRAGADAPFERIERVLADLDPAVPLSSRRNLAEAVHAASAPSRFLAALFATFAALALSLSVLGLYGVVSYSARQARRDVAIRMTLGADAADVRRHFLGQAGAVLALGLAAGVALARFLGEALAGQLHGIGPGDPTTILVVAIVLGATGLVAVWRPIGRAASMHPMRVLRED